MMVKIKNSMKGLEDKFSFKELMKKIKKQAIGRQDQLKRVQPESSTADKQRLKEKRTEKIE